VLTARDECGNIKTTIVKPQYLQTLTMDISDPQLAVQDNPLRASLSILLDSYPIADFGTLRRELREGVSATWQNTVTSFHNTDDFIRILRNQIAEDTEESVSSWASLITFVCTAGLPCCAELKPVHSQLAPHRNKRGFYDILLNTQRTPPITSAAKFYEHEREAFIYFLIAHKGLAPDSPDAVHELLELTSRIYRKCIDHELIHILETVIDSGRSAAFRKDQLEALSPRSVDIMLSSEILSNRLLPVAVHKSLKSAPLDTPWSSESVALNKLKGRRKATKAIKARCFDDPLVRALISPSGLRRHEDLIRKALRGSSEPDKLGETDAAISTKVILEFITGSISAQKRICCDMEKAELLALARYTAHTDWQCLVSSKLPRRFRNNIYCALQKAGLVAPLARALLGVSPEQNEPQRSLFQQILLYGSTYAIRSSTSHRRGEWLKSAILNYHEDACVLKLIDPQLWGTSYDDLEDTQWDVFVKSSSMLDPENARTFWAAIFLRGSKAHYYTNSAASNSMMIAGAKGIIRLPIIDLEAALGVLGSETSSFLTLVPSEQLHLLEPLLLKNVDIIKKHWRVLLESTNDRHHNRSIEIAHFMHGVEPIQDLLSALPRKLPKLLSNPDWIKYIAAVAFYNPDIARRCDHYFDYKMRLSCLAWVRKEWKDKPAVSLAHELALLTSFRDSAYLRYLSVNRCSTWRTKRKGHLFDDLYQVHSLPKKRGGNRKITAPTKRLKRLQRRLLRNGFSRVPTHAAAHGFVPTKSIITNASNHVKKKVVLNMDITGFFPSTPYRSIVAACRKYADKNLSVGAIYFLADLCSYNGGLPTGAPTSPAISNIILHKVDTSLTTACHKYGINYSRYADDLTFSGENNTVRIIPFAKKVLGELDYKCDAKKQNIYRRGRRQLVTGIVVNDKLSLPRYVRKRLRAAAHHFATGQDVFWHNKEMTRQQLMGRLGHLGSVCPVEASRLRDLIKTED
jgi:retron-type reverse transcriptase